jgi:hypothetical protein
MKSIAKDLDQRDIYLKEENGYEREGDGGGKNPFKVG